MRVAVVGAGVAGLAAARTLGREGHEVTIFEKSGAVGGRVASLQIGPYLFDTGATSIAPRGKALERAMLHELDQSDLVALSKPVYTVQYGRISPGDTAKAKIQRYVYRSGNVRLPEMLAAGLDVRLGAPIDRIREIERCYEVAGERYEAVVVSAPIPETEEILTSLGDPRRFANARYRPCLSVMLAYAVDAGDRPYHALLEPEQRHPLTWLSFESVKSPGRAPEGHSALVAQLSPAASVSLFDDTDADVVAETAVHVARLLGPDFAAPVASAVVRWRYSQPETTALFETVNRPGQRAVVASDGVMGGRVEYAYESGVMAARLLMEDPLAR